MTLELAGKGDLRIALDEATTPPALGTSSVVVLRLADGCAAGRVPLEVRLTE